MTLRKSRSLSSRNDTGRRKKLFELYGEMAAKGAV